MALPEQDYFIPDLLIRLEDPPRTRIVRFLGSLSTRDLKSRASITYISNWLSDPDPTIRRIVALALGELGARASPLIPKLLATLSDNSLHVCFDSARALQRIGPAVVRSLSLALRNNDVLFPRMGISILGYFGPQSESSLKLLMEFTDHRNSFVRTEAAEAIGRMGDVAAPAMPDLIRLIGSPHTDCVIAAIRAVLNMGNAGRAAIPILRKLFNDPDTHPEELFHAGSALICMGPEGQQIIRETTRSHFFRNRVYAFAMIEGNPVYFPEFLSMMVDLLEDNNEELRTSAAINIRRIGFNGLIELQSRLPNLSARAKAYIAAEMKHSSEIETFAVPVLLQILEDGHPAVRLSAAESLNRHRPNHVKACRQLMEIALREHGSIRESALQFLECIRLPQEMVQQLESDPSPESAEIRQRVGKRLIQTPTQIVHAEALSPSHSTPWDFEAMRHEGDLLLFLEVIAQYERGNNSFRKVSQQLEKGGSPMQPPPFSVSVAEITRCMDRLNQFFGKVFGTKDFKLFDAPKGRPAKLTDAGRRAGNWASAFFERQQQVR